MANEKRLIDANDVYSLFDLSGRATLHVADIDVIPRVDAVEVVHGWWLPTYHTYYNRDGEHRIADEWHCSKCGVYSKDEWHYCPNCGAKMDGGNEDA